MGFGNDFLTTFNIKVGGECEKGVKMTEVYHNIKTSVKSTEVNCFKLLIYKNGFGLFGYLQTPRTEHPK